MRTIDMELTQLSIQLWERFEIPFEWQIVLRHNRMWRYGISTQTAVSKDDKKEDVALRLVTLMVPLIQETIPEGAR
jgi:hypothetical protein